MEKSEDIKDLLTALAKAQGLMKVAVKDKMNPHYKSKYASPESIQEATKESLASNGLSVIQLIEENNGTHLRTILGHSSGQWIASSFKLTITRQDMQGAGSAITYARRYALSAILNVASDEDDDANLAVQKQSPFPDEWEQPKVKPKPKNVAPQSANPESFAPPSVADDFEEELKKYKIKFGKKYMGKTLFDIGIHDSKKYLEWLLGESKKAGKEPSEGVKELEQMVRMYGDYIQEKEASRSHLAPTNFSFDANEPWPEGR